MKAKLLLLFIFCCNLKLVAQNIPISNYGIKDIQQINNKGSYVLASWAGANIIHSLSNINQLSGNQKYFNQMNGLWNTVNLGLATLTIASKNNPNQNVLNYQKKIERLFLVNTFLDVGYIASGWLMKNNLYENSKNPDLIKGYGNSLILQGSFLLLYDAIMFYTHRNNRIRYIDVNLSYNSSLNSGILAINIRFSKI